MKTLLSAFLMLPGLLVLSRPALGQVAAPPDALVAAAITAAEQQYSSTLIIHPELYSGREYVDYSKPYHEHTGHQFFSSTERQPGRIIYNQHVFNNISLNYDVVLDQVIISPPGSPLTLRLINEKTAEFNLNGHRFVRLVADSSSRSVIRTGYYQVLLDSTVQVLAKRSKRQQEHINRPFIDVEFTPVDKLFIQKAGIYYPVASKSSVMRLFTSHTNQLQQYVQSHRLKFNKAAREASIVQLAAYYCSLPPQ